MKGWKATNDDLRSNLGYDYELGKTFVETDELEIESNGFHFCEQFYDCFNYYDVDDSRLFEVECENVSNETRNNDSIRVCGKITFVREVNVTDLMNSFTYEQQLALVGLKPSLIYFIANPSDEMKRLAIRLCGSCVKYIPNLSDELVKECIKRHSWAIRYIDNPSEELMLLSLKSNISNVGYLKNPTKGVYDYLIANNYKLDRIFK